MIFPAARQRRGERGWCESSMQRSRRDPPAARQKRKEEEEEERRAEGETWFVVEDETR